MNTNPTIWIVKEQVIRDDVGTVPIDYSPALKYGDLHFITTHDMPMHAGSSVQAHWTEDVINFVQEYNPEVDYIICTGQPMAIMTVGYLLGYARKIPRYLVWRRQSGMYVPVEFKSDITDLFVSPIV